MPALCSGLSLRSSPEHSASPSLYLVQQAAIDGPELTATSGLLAKLNGCYLVTGVVGFIGRSIAAELLKRGKLVRDMDNFATGKRENLRGLEAMDFIEADINDAATLAEGCRGVTCIFHEAAIPSVPRSIEDPVATNHACVSGTVQLLVAARDAKMRRVIYSGVLAKFALKMLAGEPITIFGDGEQSRDFTFIQNVMHANFLASEAPAELAAGKVFNVATGSRMTLNEAVKVLRKATGHSGEIRYREERGGDVKHSLADICEARRCLSYEPQVQFCEGLERTVGWYAANDKRRELRTEKCL